MALKRPPQHRIDATGAFIYRFDPAWDLDRVEREKAVMLELDLDTDEHPFEVYHGGKTRFDLEAPLPLPCKGEDGQKSEKTVRILDYFKAGEKPTTFVLRRLSRQQFDEFSLAVHAGRYTEGFTFAVQMGVRSINNLDDEDFGPVQRTLTKKQLDRLHDVDHELIPAVGKAVMQFSRRLSEGE